MCIRDSTNSDPTKVDFAIPSNDDATKSIAIIVNYLTAAIMEGLQERSQNKEEDNEEEVSTERMRGLDIDEEGGEKGERRGRGAGAGRGQGGGRQGGGAGRGQGGGNRQGSGNRPGASRPGAPRKA